jgi:hypothetical protein
LFSLPADVVCRQDFGAAKAALFDGLNQRIASEIQMGTVTIAANVCRAVAAATAGALPCMAAVTPQATKAIPCRFTRLRFKAHLQTLQPQSSIV